MKDDDIKRIYTQGCTTSHAAGLRAVYQAGYNELHPVVAAIAQVVAKAVKKAPRRAAVKK